MPSNSRRSSVVAPLSPLFTVLNYLAFFGWSYVLYLVSVLLLPALPSVPSDFIATVQTPVLVLEGVCIIEVLRIAVGDLPGNLLLGAVLHAIRLVAITQVLSHSALEGLWTGPAVILSWAVTEVSRYPMYIFPNSGVCRSIRMVVPLVTFPIGAISEGYGAFTVFVQSDTDVLVKILLAGMLFVNGVLGPTMAYPALLKKGLPVLGLGTSKKSDASKKKN